MPHLSAFLIVQNEAADLPGCLASLKGLTGEIVVVDSGSTDGTQALARKAGAKVFERSMDGFAAQKQFALEQCSGDWLLSIDADERLTPELTASIRQVLANPQPLAGYSLVRDMYFLGQRLRFGGVGTDRVTRLFRKGKGRFKPVRVHESIEIDGPVGELSGRLLHFSYATLDEYRQKCDHYTTLAADDLMKKGRRFRWTDYLRPGWELFNRIVLRGAWLDGYAGLTYAVLSSRASWMRSVKLKNLQQRLAQRSPCPLPQGEGGRRPGEGAP